MWLRRPRHLGYMNCSMVQWLPHWIEGDVVICHATQRHAARCPCEGLEAYGKSKANGHNRLLMRGSGPVFHVKSGVDPHNNLRGRCTGAELGPARAKEKEERWLIVARLSTPGGRARACPACTSGRSGKHATRCRAMPCYALLCHATPCHAMRCDAMRCYAMVREHPGCDAMRQRTLRRGAELSLS